MTFVTFVVLVFAGILEVFGDYLIRKGLPEHSIPLLLLGAFGLALYGFFVNYWWEGSFSKLLGLYVVVFFVVSQVWGVVLGGESMDAPRWFGGALIVLGGLVIQWGHLLRAT